MEDLVRVMYTSEAISTSPEDLDAILKSSQRNNFNHGITGALLSFNQKYFQVLEGSRLVVSSLLERIKADPRHRKFQIHKFESIKTRLFEGWSMGRPILNDSQFQMTLKLLLSDIPSSSELGLTYLKYWLTAQNIDPTEEHKSELTEEIQVETILAGHERSRKFSVIAFCVAILVAVIIDSGFHFAEYINERPGSLAMLQAHLVVALGLCAAILASRRGDLTLGVKVFQFTALTGVSLHAFYAGYGIFAPSLPYLGIAIVSSIISNQPDKKHRFVQASILLIGLALLLSAYSVTAPYFTTPVPMHHTAIAALLFPLICGLVLDSQSHGRNLNERFTARVLRDLSDTIETLKRNMAARNYFFSAISHEIRTPMNGALSAVALLEHPKANEQVKSRSLGALRQSLSNLNRLLNDLLDISKLESGRFELASLPFSLASATRETLDFFMPSIQEGENTLAASLPDEALIVHGDQMRFQQMLSNLVGNAIKFTKKGSISVTLKRAEASASADGTMWRCEVSDTGVGIPQDDIAKLFQPFSQASQHGYSKTKGTGLGLAIVSSLAKQMGGTVGVYSTEGKGSTFWFTFKMPLQQENSGTQQAA